MTTSTSTENPIALTREISSAIHFLRTTEMQTLDRVQGLISQIRRAPQGGPTGATAAPGASGAEHQLRLELQEMTNRLGAVRDPYSAAERNDHLAEKIDQILYAMREGPDVSAITASVHALKGRLDQVSHEFQGVSHTLAERDATLAHKIDQILTGMRTPIDVGAITSSVHALRSHIEQISTEVQGAGRTIADRVDQTTSIAAERISRSMEVLETHLSEKLTAFEREAQRREQDLVLRTEAKDNQQATKLNQILKYIREGANGSDLNAAYGKLDAKLDTLSEATSTRADALTAAIAHIAADLARVVEQTAEGATHGRSQEATERLRSTIAGFESAVRALQREISKSQEQTARDVSRDVERIEQTLLQRLSAIEAATIEAAAGARPAAHDEDLASAIGGLAEAISSVQANISELQTRITERDEERKAEQQERRSEDAGARALFDAQRTSQQQLMTTFRVILRQIADDAHAFHSLVTEKPAPAAQATSDTTLIDKLDALQTSIEALAARDRTESRNAITIDHDDKCFARELETRTELDVAKTSIQTLIVGFRLVLKQLADSARDLQDVTRDLSVPPAARTPVPASQPAFDVALLAKTISDAVARNVVPAGDTLSALSSHLQTGMTDIQRMIASGNQVLADIHALSSTRLKGEGTPTGSLPGQQIPSWAEAWHIFSSISTSIDAALAGVTRRLDEISAKGLDSQEVSDLKGLLNDAASDLSDKIETFLSISAVLTEDIGRAAPGALSAQFAAKK